MKNAACCKILPVIYSSPSLRVSTTSDGKETFGFYAPPGPPCILFNSSYVRLDPGKAKSSWCLGMVINR